jgi:hypothetical protein
MQAVTSKVEIRKAATGLWKHVHFSTNLHPSRLAIDSAFLTDEIHRVVVPSYMTIEYVKLMSRKG